MLKGKKVIMLVLFKHFSNIRSRIMIKSFMVFAKESAFKMCLLL